MIGNDIVDRKQAERDSNWQRKGFLEKLFTPTEQQFIYAATDPALLVWLLWSMKESVYKLVNRQSGMRVFNPAKIACTLLNLSVCNAEATVWCGNEYQVKSQFTTNYIASLAFMPEKPPVEQQHQIIVFDSCDYYHQSTAIRVDIIRSCAKKLSIPPEKISVSKNPKGIPVIVLHNTCQPIVTPSVSLSHHGYFGAYCLA